VDRFVKECRREWRRLRVPDAIANEMAAELEADLKEAESEGASPEDVLGSGVFDPRSFAASWAAERGVIPEAPAKAGMFGGSPFLAAIVALSVVAAIGAGMVIAAHVGPHGSVAVAPGPYGGPRPPFPPCFQKVLPSLGQAIRSCQVRIKGMEVVRPAFPPIKAAFAPVDGSSLNAVGWILLGVGLIGIIVLLLVRWASNGRWSGHPPRVDGASDSSGWA